VSEHTVMRVRETQPKVHPSHPFVNERNHNTLLRYVRERVEMYSNGRNTLLHRMMAIDRELHTYLVLSEDDKRRDTDNKQGKSPKAVSLKLPFLWVQADDALTFFEQVYNPPRGMFHATSRNQATQEIHNSLAARMNEDAERRGYLQQLMLFQYQAMKYNIAAIEVEWETDYGTTLKATPSRAKSFEMSEEAVWSCNTLRALDMYNTIWDMSMHPSLVPTQGEFVARVSQISDFEFRRRVARGEYVNVGKLLEHNGQALQNETTLYQQHPELHPPHGNMEGGDTQNWVSIITASATSHDAPFGMHEKVEVYIRLVPGQFGLIPARDADANKLQVWKLTILGMRQIVKAEKMSAAEGKIPVFFTVPMEDNLGTQHKSMLEQLAPLQNYGNFIVNSDVRATRSSIYGIQVFDNSVIPIDKMSEDDVAGRISVNAGGKDLTKSMVDVRSKHSGSEAAAHVSQFLQLLQGLFPTTSLQQVASMDRAVTSQVAATVTAASKRLHKMLGSTETQALYDARRQMWLNYQMSEDDIELIGSGGTPVTITHQQMLELTDFATELGYGLRSLDRLVTTGIIDRILLLILQNKEASQEFDVPGLIEYLVGENDVKLNIKQFRRQTQEPPQAQAPSNEAGAGAPLG
jgi:hypothetical protein